MRGMSAGSSDMLPFMDLIQMTYTSLSFIDVDICFVSESLLLCPHAVVHRPAASGDSMMID